MSRPAAGAAFYRVGEIHRLRGEFAKAETAYTRANEHGRKPQPGLSLLRLAQGQIDAAAASIRGCCSTRAPAARARMLGAAVEILLAAGDLENARGCRCRVGGDCPQLRRFAALSRVGARTGAVLLAEGDIAGAATCLHGRRKSGGSLGMPYEEAQTCLLMAAVCEQRGDQDGRRLELDTRANAVHPTQRRHLPGARRRRVEGATRRRAGPLSERELQVLRLLAAGKTNRDIAEELFISEKTVARHVSNIFDKLGVSSRTAATAWAYQHNLI